MRLHNGLLICFLLLYAQATSQTIDQLVLKSTLDSIANVKKAKNSVSNLQDNQYTQTDTITIKKHIINRSVFGSSLFENNNLNYLPQNNIPIPDNYELGIGDEIGITISGVQEFNETTKIDNTGNIFIPNFGRTNLMGLTISIAKQKLVSLLSNSIYTSLKNGSSTLIVTLEQVKTINVTLIGAVNSGNYNISSLSTIFHLLYLGGGPDVINSYRNIQLLRDNKVYKEIDLYDFLLYGDKKNNVTLRNGDIVMIPPYKGRVTVNGEIKRSGMFELKEDSTRLEDIIKLCGGFSDKASKNNFEITRIDNDKRKFININSDSLFDFYVRKGDQINIKTMNDKIKNIVYINGPIKYEGKYELQKNKTIKQLLASSGGLEKNAFVYKALLTREDANLIPYSKLNYPHLKGEGFCMSSEADLSRRLP